MPTPKISIDVDGVIADFVSGFTKIANRRYPNLFPPGYVQRRWHFEANDVGCTKEMVDQVWADIQREPHFWLNLSLYNSKEAIALKNFLAENYGKVDVYYVTSRVPSGGNSVLWQTQAWLKDFHLFSDSCSVIVKPQGVRKEEIYEAVGIGWSVDDYIENIPIDLTATEHKGYLIKRPWNAEHWEGEYKSENLLTVDSMEDYLNKVRQGEAL